MNMNSDSVTSLSNLLVLFTLWWLFFQFVRYSMMSRMEKVFFSDLRKNSTQENRNTNFISACSVKDQTSSKSIKVAVKDFYCYNELGIESSSLYGIGISVAMRHLGLWCNNMLRLHQITWVVSSDRSASQTKHRISFSIKCSFVGWSPHKAMVCSIVVLFPGNLWVASTCPDHSRHL